MHYGYDGCELSLQWSCNMVMMAIYYDYCFSDSAILLRWSILVAMVVHYDYDCSAFSLCIVVTPIVLYSYNVGVLII